MAKNLDYEENHENILEGVFSIFGIFVVVIMFLTILSTMGALCVIAWKIALGIFPL